MTPQEALARADTNLAVISGVAGAGKTTLLTAAQPHWGNRTTWATARNAEMARQVGEALGVEYMSLLRLRKRINKGRGSQAGDIVVCDEVALLEHDDTLSWFCAWPKPASL